MRVREYIRIKEWSDFVLKHPNGNVFQTPEMYDVYKGTKNYEPVLTVVFDNDEVVGLLLAVIQKEYTGVLGDISSRSIIIGGPLVKDNNPKIFECILKAYTEKIEKRVVFSQFRNLWNWDELKSVFIELGYDYDTHLDILIDIKPNEEDLWKKINSKARNKIRKAIKSGVTFEAMKPTGTLVEKGYDFFQEIYKKAKIPLAHKSLFESSYKVLSEKNRIKYFCAIKDGQIIGIRIGLLYKNLIYDWYAGSLQDYYKYNPNDFLPYNTLVWGHNNGFEMFDFGGAGRPNIPYGVRDHKMKFGGELVEFGRFEKVHKPKLLSVAKVGLELYKLVK